MKPIRTFTIVPSLPEPLKPLRVIAYNLHWAWDHDAIGLFLRLDSDLWESTGHNPVRMLGTIDQEKLNAAVEDEGFMAHLERVYRDLNDYMARKSTWFSRAYAASLAPETIPSTVSEKDFLVAYFSAEFGVTECLSIFAGGLGILAGDHLKSSSDLGVPLVGVGLLYQQGYFRQYLNQAGWQQEAYEDNDFYNLPIHLVERDGAPLKISVALPGREVYAQIWLTQVGRVPLYLLDTNISENQRPEDRDITDQLYGGDQEMRMKQEILLGVGGYQALEALGMSPTIYHMNEGHSAFLALEHTRRLMEEHGLTFAEARELASASLVFTTHTPVPAGHDYFPPYLMDRYFDDYPRKLGVTRRDFLALGRRNPDDDNESFCMTILALKFAARSNGVSRLHGKVSRDMWRDLWPGVPEGEIPIEHITNGVHFPSWISRDMNHIYDRYLGPRWREVPSDSEMWQRAENLAAEELWRTHERRRERLVAFVRRRLREQLERRGAPRTEVEASSEVLDPEALTIGFARRFATYKRATLVFRDPNRLARIVNALGRPVQFIFAGKAHPRDDPGKALIQQIVGLARQDRFRYRLVFLEDYDMTVARYMVQGVDVWLNTPRRPREASGTSGMKAAANGVLNLSILDGWWDEAYEPGLGWAIGKGETVETGFRDNPEYQDQVESEALYDLLERDVVPTFYDRVSGNLPRRWIDMMKANLKHVCPFFNTNRMVREYTDHFYMPTADRYYRLISDNMKSVKDLASWRERIWTEWSQVKVTFVGADSFTELMVGDDICVRARIHLGPVLTPDDVSVEFYMGLVDSNGEFMEAKAHAMIPISVEKQGHYLYEVNVPAWRRSGRHGYTVRVLPKHRDLTTPFLPGYIVWAE